MPRPPFATRGAYPSSCLVRCVVGGWNQHLIPPATPRLGVTHEHAHICTHTVTGLVVGLNPHGSGGLPTELCRTSEIIPALVDSHRMLIPSHLFYCTIKSGSSSQSLLLLSSPLSLSITLHPLLQSPKISPTFPAPSSFYHLLLTPSSPLLKSLDPCFLLESDKASSPFSLILSFRSPGPALPISPALIFSSPRKQNTNQPVIITLLEEEAPNAKAQLLHVDVETVEKLTGRQRVAEFVWMNMCWMCSIFKSMKVY